MAFLEDLLHTSRGYVHVTGDIFYSHALAFLTSDPMDLRLVQLHILELIPGLDGVRNSLGLTQ